jgi:hypothetical protein
MGLRNMQRAVCCYLNYSLGQTDDWMNEIYPLRVAGSSHHDRHAGQLVSGTEAMIDRLVCADRGNGKTVKEPIN